jgi:hypothetical protein
MSLGSFAVSHLVFRGLLVITPALRRANSAPEDYSWSPRLQIRGKLESLVRLEKVA